VWRRLVYWQGAFGYPRLLITNYVVQPSTAPGLLDATIAGYSNADIVQISEGPVSTYSASPTAAIYPSVTQLARLHCIDTAGLAFQLSIPAPLAAIFAADLVTVLPAVLTAVLGAAVSDSCVSPYGNAISGIVSGLLNGPAFPGSSLS
jgi:hypothetical protein